MDTRRKDMERRGGLQADRGEGSHARVCLVDLQPGIRTVCYSSCIACPNTVTVVQNHRIAGCGAHCRGSRKITLQVQVGTLRPREAACSAPLEPRPRPPHLGSFHRTQSPRGTRAHGVQAPLWTGRLESQVIDSSVRSVERRPQPSQQPSKFIPPGFGVRETLPQTPSGTAFS